MPNLETQLKNKPAHERANTKGQEIVRTAQKLKHIRSQYEIEIVEANAIDGGVEVFARAWKDGEQIGFGDGTVDIERFLIYNPPILVDDPNGDIVREWIDDITGEAKQRKLREDAQEALLQVLEHNLTVMTNIHGSEQIVKGKRGRTTSTFYPDAGSGGTTVDGPIRWTKGTHPTFATMHDDTTASTVAVSLTPTVFSNFQAYGFTSSDEWLSLARSAFTFDTSSLSGATISAVTFSVYGTNKSDAGVTGWDAKLASNVCGITLAANNDLAVGDYDGVATTRFVDSDLSYASFDAAGYNDYSFNASGIAAVDTEGITALSVRSAPDIDGSGYPAHPGNIGVNPNGFLVGSYADETGTTQDPKLVVEHSAVSTFIPLILSS